MFGFLFRLFKRHPKSETAAPKKNIFGFLLQLFKRRPEPQAVTEQQASPVSQTDADPFSDGLAIDDSDLEGGEVLFDNDDMLSMEEINLAIHQADKLG